MPEHGGHGYFPMGFVVVSNTDVTKTFHTCCSGVTVLHSYIQCYIVTYHMELCFQSSNSLRKPKLHLASYSIDQDVSVCVTEDTNDIHHMILSQLTLCEVYISVIISVIKYLL